MGMLLLLFNIGLELDLRELRNASRFVLKATALIILAEALAGTLLVRFLFGYSWAVSFLIALSFATVGEAVLVPILEEFGMVNSRLGQFIIGVGTLDDVFELATILWASAIVGLQAGHAGITIGSHLGALVLLFVLAAGLRFLNRLHIRMPYPRLGAALPAAFFIFFLFVGVGEFANVAGNPQRDSRERARDHVRFLCTHLPLGGYDRKRSGSGVQPLARPANNNSSSPCEARCYRISNVRVSKQTSGGYRRHRALRPLQHEHSYTKDTPRFRHNTQNALLNPSSVHNALYRSGPVPLCLPRSKTR